MEEKLSIALTVKEIEFILNALAKFPYAEVSAMIANLTDQAKAQMSPVKTPEVNDV
jgi:hypothetical protein